MKNLLFILAFTFVVAIAQTETVDSNLVAVDTVLDSTEVEDSSFTEKNDSVSIGSVISQADIDSIQVEGLILDSASGEIPEGELRVRVGNELVSVSSEGEFTTMIADTNHIGISVSVEGYGRFSKELEFDIENRFYFVTVQLSQAEEIVVTPADTTKGIPWEINGSITNSRFDVAIDDTTARLYFDDVAIPIGKDGEFKEGKFKVSTKVSGEHTFKLTIKGYHTVYEKIVLAENDKHVYHNVATTQEGFENVRREMTVTAQSEPIHETSSSAKITLTRKDLQRTAATMTDPIRVLQTLPGVASESDASARPIVRGGDVLESRVFIDGIPLIQPYHFGGVRSIFNQSGIENLTLYKSGFPSRYHDAQSAIITVDSRDPITEKFIALGDVNLMQYNAYVAFPLIDEKLGMYISTQGSYANTMFKAGWALGSRMTKEGRDIFSQHSKSFNIPDYQDVGGGISWNISERLKLSVHESFNTDRFKSTYRDTVATTTYNYDNIYYHRDTLRDTVFYYQEKTGNPDIDKYLRDTSFSIAKSVTAYNEDNYYSYQDYNGYTESAEEQYELYTVNWNQPISFEDVAISYNGDGDEFSVEKNYSSYSQGDPFVEYDTIIDYKSRYNILHADLSYQYDKDNQFDFKVAWQKRWWDLAFPDDYSEFIGGPKYDVHINQFNLIGDWTNTSYGNHTLNGGMQLDLTITDYDVYIPRFVHEIITKGNTNFGDFWGPLSGDTGMDFSAGRETVEEDTSYFYYNDYDRDGDMTDMTERMLMSYKGEKTFLNGSLFFEDEWRVNDRWRLNMGTRFEVSSVDTSVTLSPRITSHLSLNRTNEFTASVGLYSQNNYDIATMALSEVLKPEKVWHLDLGLETQLLPWLTQKVNLFGKYYYDLASERINESDPVNPEDQLEELTNYVDSLYPGQSIEDFDINEIYNSFMAEKSTRLYQSHYSNSGKGYSYGLEYLLMYKPRDYWNGWLSFTLQKAERQRHEGWRWHTFPFSRPLLISWVNYYRLPRKYEIGIKYRFMLGMPYTEINTDNGTYVGDYNAKQYAPYSRLDIRIAKGIETKHTKMHFYLEGWNIMNRPNVYRRDSESKKIQTTGFDVPVTTILIGLDFEIQKPLMVKTISLQFLVFSEKWI